MGFSESQGVISEMPVAELIIHAKALEVRNSTQNTNKTPRQVQSTGTDYSHLEARSRRHEGESAGGVYPFSRRLSP